MMLKDIDESAVRVLADKHPLVKEAWIKSGSERIAFHLTIACDERLMAEYEAECTR